MDFNAFSRQEDSFSIFPYGTQVHYRLFIYIFSFKGEPLIFK